MATQVTLNSGSVDSAGSLALKTNGTTTAVTINTSQGVEFNAGTAAAPTITTTGDTNTGIFFPAADTIAFSEGGVESMRIDSSGNVGIGTSSPGSKLDINRGSAGLIANFTDGVNTNFQIGTSSLLATIGPSAGSTAMAFKTADTERMRIDSSGNVGIGTSSPTSELDVLSASGANIIYSRVTGTTSADSAQMQCVNGSVVFQAYAYSSGAEVAVGSASNHPLAFRTNSAERMRLDSSGNLLVGTTSQLYGERLNVTRGGSGNNVATFYFNTSDDRAAIIVRHAGASGATSRKQLSFLDSGGTERGSISSTGSATAYTTSSDYRLKENVEPMTGALAKVALLKPCTYKWKVDGSDGQGFIAHELQEVYPDAVTGEKDGEQMQGVDYGKLTPILTAALQEAIAKIETLEVRIAVLEAK